MISAATAELATFNVPFFAIDGTLIIRNANKNGEVPKGKILEKDLEELKAKMIKLLEDLCGE